MKFIKILIVFQSGEIEDMRELFELLDIKSDVWKSTKDLRPAEYDRHHGKISERSRTSSKTDINSNESSKELPAAPGALGAQGGLGASSHSESERASPPAGCSKGPKGSHSSSHSHSEDLVKIKHEVFSNESSTDEKEEGELDDECVEEMRDCARVGSRRRSSLNPVNLSLARSSEHFTSETENSRDMDAETVAAKKVKTTYL